MEFITLGDYEYCKKDFIAHGAFAAVFKGRNKKKPDIAVAIKSIAKRNISKSPNYISKEIKILKELNHENVVTLLEYKETTDHVHLIIEFCNGGDFADYLQAKGTLSEDTIRFFLNQIVAAMGAIHAKGIIHRDLKPHNILMCFPPGTKNPPVTQIILKIADFGFARFLPDGAMAGTMCGSPMYMAPEVILNLQYDAKADLWSVGTIVFQSLTGKAPFQAQNPQQLISFYEKHTELRPNIPDGTSPALKDLLYRTLKRNPKDRIEFEDFFNHQFLKPPSPASSSSPVPVPYRSPSFSSGSPASQKAASASPLSGKMECSPTQPKCFLKGGKSDQTLVNREYPVDSPEFVGTSKKNSESRCSTPTEDFVMVPEEIGIDGSDGLDNDKMMAEDLIRYGDTPTPSLNIVTANPVAMKVLFKKDSSSSLNANRPSSLKVTSPTPSDVTTEPLPVPTQRSKYERMTGNTPSSPLAVNKLQDAMGGEGQQKMDCNKKEKSLVSQVSETRLPAPDVLTLSPPVQFSIGTPPGQGGQWRRSSIINSPRGQSSITSPLRRSETTPVHLSPIQISALVQLPTIHGSPVKVPGPYQYPTSNIEAQLWSQKASNVPENSFANGNVAIATHLKSLHASKTEPEFRNITEDSRSLLSQQLFREAFGSHLHGQLNEGQIIPFAQGFGVKLDRVNSLDSDKPGLAEMGERSSCYFRRNSETTPPPSLLYTQSPPNMEGPITFIAPELTEETLMDDAHNMTMAKLNFVLDLVECIIELARIKGAKVKTFTDSVICRPGEALSAGLELKFADTQRRVEQLILYVRSLHLLSSSLYLARDEMKEGRLQATTSLKSVVRQMNELYHRCVLISRQLQQRLGIEVESVLTPTLLVATADKLLYIYAVEMCQVAALDEINGDPRECFKRYQAAQILFHSIAQQAYNSRDKELLSKYQEAVERRLASLQMHTQTYIQPHVTSS
ncbi:hypothetical protein CHS0354_031645 [Potamilus streckersoni]|uniref:Protein kinase domain-containing protein n=1 Tax=Potamilus streckersoni TaxID=2493646 RepID=A0AAE0SHG9_9BIVA|nr:hypothetical protein CHS0354_031645 [Potamilus streckersoni]